jgi:hypothetical protein
VLCCKLYSATSSSGFQAFVDKNNSKSYWILSLPEEKAHLFFLSFLLQKPCTRKQIEGIFRLLITARALFIIDGGIKIQYR